MKTTATSTTIYQNLGNHVDDVICSYSNSIKCCYTCNFSEDNLRRLYGPLVPLLLLLLIPSSSSAITSASNTTLTTLSGGCVLLDSDRQLNFFFATLLDFPKRRVVGYTAVLCIHTLLTSKSNLNLLPQDSFPGKPAFADLPESCVPSGNFASTTEGIIESGPYTGKSSG